MAQDEPQVYRIRVYGRLDRSWSDWFGGLAIECEGRPGEPAVTTLAGPVADQAVLRGILCKLMDLNLVLISVRLVASELP